LNTCLHSCPLSREFHCEKMNKKLFNNDRSLRIIFRIIVPKGRKLTFSRLIRNWKIIILPLDRTLPRHKKEKEKKKREYHIYICGRWKSTDFSAVEIKQKRNPTVTMRRGKTNGERCLSPWCDREVNKILGNKQIVQI